MEFRLSTMQDANRIMEIIAQAKEHLKEQGVDQWQNAYPDIATIEKDIASKEGYVLLDGEAIIGYFCVSFSGEVSYKDIVGCWRSNQDYGTVHRLAIDNCYKGKGLAVQILRFAQEVCIAKNIHSIRADTDNDNAAMMRIFEKNGFIFCGVVRFDNSNKVAFEKLI